MGCPPPPPLIAPLQVLPDSFLNTEPFIDRVAIEFTRVRADRVASADPASVGVVL